MTVVCAGGGGFVGGHLVKRLLDEGHEVRAVDIKPLDRWWQVDPRAVNCPLHDLSKWGVALRACSDATEVYMLAADMGGIFWIAYNKLDCMLSVLTSTHMLKAAATSGVKRFFYSSSACIYPSYRQDTTLVPGLKESDAYPADSEDGYGWEKLFTERMCRHFTEDKGLITRVARYHNVMGPHGSWADGREKAPAAICRKVATAKITGADSIEIWGDGKQTRSFLYVDDCVEGTIRLMASDFPEPLNIGSDYLVSINELVSLVEKIAGVELEHEYVSGPQGVRGRCSDNTLCKEVLGWEPSISLVAGLERLYPWIEDQVRARLGSLAKTP